MREIICSGLGHGPGTTYALGLDVSDCLAIEYFWLWDETVGPWKSFVLANSTYALGLEASDGLAVDQVYQGSGLEG